MSSHISLNQVRCLRQAASQPDGTVLAIGFSRHNPTGQMKTYSINTADALAERGFLDWVKKASWGHVYKITPLGRQFISSYDSGGIHKKDC